MKARVVFDVDGTEVLIITGHYISTQIFRDGSGVALIKVYNKKRKLIKFHHFTKVYTIEVTR